MPVADEKDFVHLRIKKNPTGKKLIKLADANRRSITEEAHIAIEKHVGRKGKK